MKNVFLAVAVAVLVSTCALAQSPAQGQPRSDFDNLIDMCKPHYYGALPHQPARADKGWEFCLSVMQMRDDRASSSKFNEAGELAQAKKMFNGLTGGH